MNKKNKLTAIVNINIEILTGETDEVKAKEYVENYELPHGYVPNSFEIVKFMKEDDEIENLKGFENQEEHKEFHKIEN